MLSISTPKEKMTYEKKEKDGQNTPKRRAEEERINKTVRCKAHRTKQIKKNSNTTVVEV
jgi:hypothetical protein